MSWGKTLIGVGVALVILGLVFVAAERAGMKPFGWVGRLPGDIRIEREGLRIYFPLATGLLLSAVLTLVLWVLRR
jgi:hypothetical protein